MRLLYKNTIHRAQTIEYDNKQYTIRLINVVCTIITELSLIFERNKNK